VVPNWDQASQKKVRQALLVLASTLTAPINRLTGSTWSLVPNMMHLDWGASQFLTKQWQVGLVGYLYQEIGCDSGSGDRVGCFQYRAFSASAHRSATFFRSETNCRGI
jgi:hypothetical protein